jgi:uncharacterized membrane protein YeaQ/YmgE (transglycosylase-associated protein family)
VPGVLYSGVGRGRERDRLVTPLDWILLGTLSGVLAHVLLLGRFPSRPLGASLSGTLGALLGAGIASLLLSREVSGLNAKSFAIALFGSALLIACYRYGRLFGLVVASRRAGSGGPAERPHLVLIPGGRSEARSGATPSSGHGGGS